MTKVCDDLVVSIVRQMKQNAEWSMELWTSTRSRYLESGLWLRRSSKASPRSR